MFGLLSEQEIEDEMKFFVKRWRRYGPKGWRCSKEFDLHFSDGYTEGISEVLDDLEKVFGIFEKEPKV